MEDNGRYSPEKLKRYPHMFALDIAIWERFIDQYSGDYAGFDYDIKVGSGTEAPKGTSDNYRRMQEILSKYRVDCVGYTDSTITIIEVKPEAGTIAAGQIALYTRLYERDYRPSRKIKGAIVTDRELPDMRWYCEKEGVSLYIV